MDLAAAGLREQPFRTHGKPLVTVSYASYRDAFGVLKKTCESPNGLCLLQGPPLSGKSTLIRDFAATVPDDCSVAIVDGTGLNTAGLLESLLRQFGYMVDFNSTGELLAMTRVFALQQAASHEPPLIVVENAHALNPSALRALAELAQLRVRHVSAIKLILVSNRSLRTIIDSPAMASMAMRLIADFHLHPMSSDEAIDFLHRKLRAAGSEIPEFIFPPAICHELWRASGGWPGILDRISLLALAKAPVLPIAISNIERPAIPQGTWDASTTEADVEAAPAPPATPSLYVTENGKTINELVFDKPRMLIGRSEHNDLSIDSRFVSRHHMLLVRHGSATFLMDLNSTNGTLVNSRRVSNHVLIDNDIISVGDHRIKFCDPHAKQRGSLDGAEFADTAIMKTLEDMRNLLEQENTAEFPAQTEDLPTFGGEKNSA